jgi:hypothetical protein
MKIELIGDGHHVPKEVLQLALKIKGADSINLIKTIKIKLIYGSCAFATAI